jgi:tRNA uridine 5-carbamoylmethylation protein Kti12
MPNNDHVPLLFNYSVLLLCGLPSSGKSTIASLLTQQVNNNPNENKSNINEETCHDCLCNNCHGSTRVNASSFLHQYYDDAYWINYDDITECILGEKIEIEKQTQGEQDEIIVTDENMEECHYFDQTHREAWHAARVVAQERLEQLLLLHHGLKSTTEEQQQKYKTICSFCGSCYNVPQRRILIVLDDNFHLQSMRRDIYRLCQRIVGDDKSTGQLLTIGFSILVVHTHPSICKERNATRKGRARVPEAVMNNMISTMEYPTNDKNKSVLRINTSQIDYSSSCSCDEILFKPIKTLLLTSLNHPIIVPVQPDNDHNETKDCCSRHNPLHSIDLILRHLVGLTCTKDKSLARQANKVRKVLLDKYRQEYKDSIISHEFDKGEVNDNTNSINNHILGLNAKHQDVIYRQFVEGIVTGLGEEKINLPVTQGLINDILKCSLQSSPSRNVLLPENY